MTQIIIQDRRKKDVRHEAIGWKDAMAILFNLETPNWQHSFHRFNDGFTVLSAKKNSNLCIKTYAWGETEEDAAKDYLTRLRPQAYANTKPRFVLKVGTVKDIFNNAKKVKQNSGLPRDPKTGRYQKRS